MAWEVTDGTNYANVHSNSGIFTYGGEGSLCGGGVPKEKCTPYTNYRVEIKLMHSSDFDEFNEQISKTINAKSCNQEMLVMWFNDEASNTSYQHILDDNSIFDTKNVDECQHIVISNNLREGSQTFEDSSYVDSGYPFISTDPCSSGSSKYESGVTYDGHKIKYRPTSTTIPDNFYKGHDELVELYFPHMYTENEIGKNTKTIGANAFSGCSRLSAITLSSVEYISGHTFQDCTGLKIIDWGHDTCCSSEIKHIGVSAFQGCRSIEKLCLNKLVKIEAIDAYGFYGCVKVTYLSLPTALTYNVITNYCFASIGADGNGVSEIIIPNNIKNIGEHAFFDFKLVNEGKLDIGAGITDLSSIGASAFNTNIMPYKIKVRIQGVNDYNNIIGNLINIFNITEMRIDFYVDSSLVDSLNNYYHSSGHNNWNFYSKDLWS